MSARAPMLDVVHAAYQVDLDPQGWLDGLLAAAGPSLDRGLGVMAWSLRVGVDGRHAFTSPIAETQGLPTGMADACARFNDISSPMEVALTHGRPGTVATTSDALRSTCMTAFEREPRFAEVRALGALDCMAVKALDPAGFGFAFAAPMADVRAPPAELEQRWRRVMTHVLAGLRLRSAPRSDGEAVLEPDGRIVHAERSATSRSARDKLREAAVTIDRARAAGGRADPDAALARWKSLVAGRWSLVDRFDADGRRFLIARRNDPAVDGSPALTERERQVVGYAAMGYTNQHIAYVFGLAPSTVSTHLRRAMRHLGVTRRADLAALRVPPPRPDHAE